MAEKQLWQIGWEGGQTDGDVGPQTVRELLNVELDRPGILRPRDVLVQHKNIQTLGLIDVQYIPGPLDSTKVLRVSLFRTSIQIHDETLNTTETLSFASIDYDSKLYCRGNDIYVVSLTSGQLNHIHTASFIKTQYRFRAPLYCTGNSNAALQPIIGHWVLVNHTEDVPTLHLAMVGHTVPASPPRTDNRSEYLAAVDHFCLPNKNAVVMAAFRYSSLTSDTRDIADYIPLVAAKGIYAAEFAVQYEFIDGSVSAMSNSVQVRTDFGNLATISHLGVGIATTISVSRALPDSVAAINVYRRTAYVSDAGTPEAVYEQIYVANVLSERSVAADSLLSQDVLNKPYEMEGTDYPQGMTQADCGQPMGAPGLFYWNKARTFVGLAALTTGWLGYTSGSMTFVPRTLIGMGTHTYWLGYLNDPERSLEFDEDDLSAWYYKLTSVGVFGYQYDTGAGSATVALWDDQVQMTPTISGGGKSMFPVYYSHIPNLLNADKTKELWSDIGGVAFVQAVNPSVKGKPHGVLSWLTYTGTGTAMGADRKPLFLYLDDSTPGFSFEQINGANENEWSVVKPKVATVAAGRMVCLNVNQDGESRPARLCYSEFRKYRVFRKSNYIDYGPRDDGYGVALASFSGRLLVLHSTSSYILDISSGSDMSWREIGSFNDIGCISSKAVVETAVGVFFCSPTDIYWFNGEQLQKISEIDGRTIHKTYRLMDKAKVTLAWKPGMRQLWVCNGAQNVLVFDFDRGQWHTHDLAADSMQGELVRFFSVDGIDISTVVNRNPGVSDTIRMYTASYPSVNVPFEWGVSTGPITMGAAEIIKKGKSLFIDYDGSGSEKLRIGVWYTQLPPQVQDMYFDAKDGPNVKRVRVSLRKNWLNLTFRTIPVGGVNWCGVIESLGLSYKPKRLK